jgi:hypothetical protein
MMANEIIPRLNVAQENRQLSEELQLQKELKARVIGLVVVGCSRCRQASRLVWLKEKVMHVLDFFISRLMGAAEKTILWTLKISWAT